jgi:diguanylate cyclase (GGDEF)-like protein
MHLDLLTLYGLAIGTLLVSAAMTLWERQARPERSTALGIWAGGYALLAAGCGLAIARTHLPAPGGWALSNLVILSGYLLILNGIGHVNGRRYGQLSAGILAVVALVWAAGGFANQAMFWNYGSAFPIALACGLAARELLRDGPLRSMRSLPLPVAITGGHAIFYAFRSLVLPVLVAHHGGEILPAVGEATLYEGVLYSVAMPMALLALVREEAQGHLLAASRTDFLTGLGNRQRFFEEGVPMLRGDAPLSLLAFDLDHFKTINDRWGHAAGDEVLKSFARVAREIVGKDALLVRLGGEEFAALLPGEDSWGAQQVGEAVARRLAATGNGEDGRIRATVSVGVAEYGVDGSDLQTLMSTADRALYAAKAMGRNRTTFARPLTLVTHA